MVFTHICSSYSHLSSWRPAKKQLGSANVAKEAVEKLGQPAVPLRHKKIRHVTIDEKFCPLDERAVIERMSGNPAETRQQTNKLSYPVETGSTGSRKPELPVFSKKFDIFNFLQKDSERELVASICLLSGPNAHNAQRK